MKDIQENTDHLTMINMDQQYELEHWAKELEITLTTLKIATKKVGPSLKDIKNYLGLNT